MAPSSKKSKGDSRLWKPFMDMFDYVHNNIVSLNQSKMFAGLIIIILNISSKFVTIKLSKSMESYLKFTFSRDILVFAMAWMGTRDIYIAALIMIVFSICVDYLLNEESRFCCLPESFTGYHIEKMENMTPTPEEIEKAKRVLELVGGTNGSPGGTNGSPKPPPSGGTVGSPETR
jgi:hypothetical protein